MVKKIITSIINVAVILYRLSWLIILLGLFVSLVVWGVQRHLAFDWASLWSRTYLYVYLFIAFLLLLRWVAYLQEKNEK